MELGAESSDMPDVVAGGVGGPETEVGGVGGKSEASELRVLLCKFPQTLVIFDYDYTRKEKKFNDKLYCFT